MVQLTYMEKKLKAHYSYIAKQVSILKNKPDEKKLSQTLSYHQAMVKNFQHERLIHLLVTLFFSLMLVLFFISALFVSIWPTASISSTYLLTPLALITLIVLITDLFYIRHYYKLENGVEKLYDLTKQLYDLKPKLQ